MSKILRLTYKAILVMLILIAATSSIKPYTASAEQPTAGAYFIVPGPNLLKDPSFEDSYGRTDGPWLQTPSDTICVYWDPVCQANGAGYHSGGGWAWFLGNDNSSNLISQRVIFPRCGARLQFALYIGLYFGPGQAYGMNNYFAARIDGTPVFEAHGYDYNSYLGYQWVNVDVSQYADGAYHTVEFYGLMDQNFLSFNLDTVSLTQTVSPSSGCAGVRVLIGGPVVAFYGVSPGTGDRVSFAGIEKGPVVLDNFANAVPFVASERVAYSPDGGTTWTSFSELMGLPFNSLGKRYYFPWYNNKTINTQLRVGSLDTDFDTTVKVKIGGIPRGSYNLPPNTTLRVSYPNLDSGPVVIESSSELIIASERVAYQNPQNNKWTSFTEMVGLPAGQLSTTYHFPWFNNVNLNSQLRFGNVGTTPTTVYVRIGGALKGTYPLAPNESKRVAYSVDSGPVLIQSSGAPIVASLRVAYTPDNGATWPDVSEMMGLPASAVSTSYHFPWYNRAGLDTQLRFANVGGAPTTVKVKIGGVLRGSYSLAPNVSTRVSYPGLNSGPVVIESTNGVKIIASERVAYFNSTVQKWTSFSEMMGLPTSQLSPIYIFPFYNSVNLDTQLRFGVP